MTNHPPISLDELKRVASEATPGPWGPCLGSGNNEMTAIHFEGNDDHPYGLMVCDLIPDYMLEDAHKKDLEYKPANMKYLTTFDPPTVLALIAVIERARDGLKDCECLHDLITETGVGEALTKHADDCPKCTAIADIDKLLGGKG